MGRIQTTRVNWKEALVGLDKTDLGRWQTFEENFIILDLRNGHVLDHEFSRLYALKSKQTWQRATYCAVPQCFHRTLDHLRGRMTAIRGGKTRECWGR